MIKSKNNEDVELALTLYKNLDIADRNITNKLIAKALVFDKRATFYSSIDTTYTYKELLTCNLTTLIKNSKSATNLYLSILKEIT